MVPHILGLVNTKISDGMISWKKIIFTTASWFLGISDKNLENITTILQEFFTTLQEFLTTLLEFFL